ncbi:MAG: penicillin-binding protein activator LpoB [Candidatus Omnitrophota bacterium]
MFKNKIFLLAAVFVMVAFVAGCGGRSVKRLDTEKVVDISGRWNDTDSRLVSEEMIKDCLGRPWLNKFDEKNKKEPVVIVGTIVNRSHEHVDALLFTKDLEMAFVNSAMVKVVASKQEREEIRGERGAQQEGLTDDKTIKELGKETGADFMLQGSINSVKDEIKGKYVILYQVNLELIDLTDNQKAWIGQRKIKKYVQKSKFSL